MRRALAAGLICFGLAAVVTGYLPVKHLSRIPYRSLEQVAPRVSQDFLDLARRYPESFARHYGKPDVRSGSSGGSGLAG